MSPENRQNQATAIDFSRTTGHVHARSLNKSTSVPTQRNEETTSWIAKLGKFFKSISALDPVSRDKAVASIDNARGQHATAQTIDEDVHAEADAEDHQECSHSAIAKTPPSAPFNRIGAAPPKVVTKGQLLGNSADKSAESKARFSKLQSNFTAYLSGIFRKKGDQQQERHSAPTPHVARHAFTVTRRSAPPSAQNPSVTGLGHFPPRMNNAGARRHSQPADVSNGIHNHHERRGNNTNIIAMSNDLPPGMEREVWCIEDYRDVREIHSGYASEVYRAICRVSGEKVALKIYHPDRLHEISQHQLLREARLHVQLTHPNIIQLYAAFKQEDGVVLVMEYADGDDLLKLLLKQARLSEHITVQLVVQPLLKALQYLHSNSIVHRDVKLENILFSGPDMTLKLADFGLCLNLKEERSVTRAGTLDYMAPEVLKCPTKNLPEENKERSDLAYTCSVDVWALGVVAYELLNGMPPFSRMDRNETERLITLGWRPPFQVHASQLAMDFIYSCLKRQSASRPSAHQLLKHPWVMATSRPASHQAHNPFDRQSHRTRQSQQQQQQQFGRNSLAAKPQPQSPWPQPYSSSRAGRDSILGGSDDSDGQQEGEYVEDDRLFESSLPNAVPDSVVEAALGLAGLPGYLEDQQQHHQWQQQEMQQQQQQAEHQQQQQHVHLALPQQVLDADASPRHHDNTDMQTKDLPNVAEFQAAAAAAAAAGTSGSNGSSSSHHPDTAAAQKDATKLLLALPRASSTQLPDVPRAVESATARRGSAFEVSPQEDLQNHYKNNSVKRAYLDRVSTIDGEAAQRRAGRLLKKQVSKLSRQQQQLGSPHLTTGQARLDQMDGVLGNAMPGPKPKMGRAWSELSRHTSDAGCQSTGSYLGDDDEDEG